MSRINKYFESCGYKKPMKEGSNDTYSILQDYYTKNNVSWVPRNMGEVVEVEWPDSGNIVAISSPEHAKEFIERNKK